jgi:hypothetical protein
MTYALSASDDTPATGGVRMLLRAEGLALLAAAAGAYVHFGLSWALFAALFLAPDIALAAYLLGPRIGAAVYNALHATLAPLALSVAGLVSGAPLALAMGLIWLAHIGFDRALGYGLKYASGFGDTHLSRLGRA